MGPIIGSWPNLWRAKSKQSSRIILIFSSLQYVCWFVHASCLVWPLSLPVAASTMRVVAISDNNFSTKYIQQIVEDFVLLREHAQGLGNWRYFPKVVCVSDFRQCIHGALTRPTIPASISTSVMSHRTSLSMLILINPSTILRPQSRTSILLIFFFGNWIFPHRSVSLKDRPGPRTSMAWPSDKFGSRPCVVKSYIAVLNVRFST
jgi:hypothetical protein